MVSPSDFQTIALFGASVSVGFSALAIAFGGERWLGIQSDKGWSRIAIMSCALFLLVHAIDPDIPVGFKLTWHWAAGTAAGLLFLAALVFNIRNKNAGEE
jgi:Na+-transporting NADH:ubiquinone oxidoreductase subunit NqrB